MTNEKGKDFIERAIDELAAYSEKADDDGLIVQVPMTPSHFPPLKYKRVEPNLWFMWLVGAEVWEPVLDDALEHIFQAGINTQNKPNTRANQLADILNSQEPPADYYTPLDVVISEIDSGKQSCPIYQHQVAVNSLEVAFVFDSTGEKLLYGYNWKL